MGVGLTPLGRLTYSQGTKMVIALTPLLLSLGAAAGAAIVRGTGALIAEKASGPASLLRSTKGARVEPITLLDNDLVTWDKMIPLLQTTTNIFGCIYLQALALNDTTVAGTKVMRRLDGLNPNRPNATTMEIIGGAVRGSKDRLSMEAFDNMGVGGGVANFLPDTSALYADKLPDVEDFLSMEAAGEDPFKKQDSGQATVQSMDTLKDAPDLSVGKLLEVTLRADGETHKIPMMIRLATTRVPNAQLTQALKSRFEDQSTALERKAGVRSGRLSFVQDVIFAKDVRKKRFKELAYDDNGLQRKLNPDRLDNAVSTVVSGQMNVAQASSILIMTSETAQKTEIHLGGRFDRQQFRERLFAATGIMLLVVVDRDADMVTFYYDTIADGHEVTGSSLKNQAAKNGPDIETLMKAMLSGSGRF